MIGGGALESSVTLDEVFTVLGGRRVPLAPELAGYLVLEIAEHADPNGGDVDPRAVFVSEEGTVALVKPRREGHAGDAEASIRAMLARLLDASGSQTPALAAAGKRKNLVGLLALAEELETALIPVNRAAGRRALARLAREVRRVTLGVGRNALPSSSDGTPSSRRASHASYPAHPASAGDGVPVSSARPSALTFAREEDPTTTRGHIPEELLRKAIPAGSSEMPTVQFEVDAREPSPSQLDVDSLISDFGVSGGGEKEHVRELKAIAGLEPTPAPPASRAASDPSDTAVEALLSLASPPTRPERPAGRGQPQPAPATPSSDPLSPARAPRRGKDDGRQLPTQPSQLKRTRASIPSAPQVASRRGSAIFVAIAMAAVSAGAYAVWQLRPVEVENKPAALVPAVPSASATVPRTPAACKATLVVTDVPVRAEVLLRQGQAPVDVEKMPVGARLEFVATAEGFAPKRVVVPTGATWDTGPDGKPRFEAAVQLDKSSARAGANDPWPAAEPGTEVGGQGQPGTIHVVATPRGAEVWMLTGMGPEARVEQLRCDRDFDVLIAGPGAFRKRIRVAAADFAVEPASGALPGAASPAAKTPARLARISAR
jgi:hypothetical protein